MKAPHPFPRMRWAALLWLAVWAPSYAVVWGFTNFLHVCDVAVILTCLGLWRGSPLLISSQAVSSIVVDLLWDLDLVWRVVSGATLLGWTDYMWDARFPLSVRLLSLFHVVWPPLLLWSLGRVGYDRRGLALQCGITVVFTAAARFADPALNINFAHRDPFFQRSWGVAPLHMTVIVGALVAVAYVPTHWALARAFGPPRAGGEGEGRLRPSSG